VTFPPFNLGLPAVERYWLIPFIKGIGSQKTSLLVKKQEIVYLALFNSIDNRNSDLMACKVEGEGHSLMWDYSTEVKKEASLTNSDSVGVPPILATTASVPVSLIARALMVAAILRISASYSGLIS